MESLYREKIDVDPKNEIVFQSLTWESFDSEEYKNDDEDENKEVENKHEFYIFGITTDNKSITVKIDNFLLYFYVLLPDHFTNKDLRLLYNHLKYFERTERQIKFNMPLKEKLKGLVDYKVLTRMKLFPYTAGRKYKFLKLSFTNQKDMNNCRNQFYTKTHGYKHLKCLGTKYRYHRFELFESNVNPLTRFFQVTELESTGYIRIKNYLKNDDKNISTQISIKTNYENLQPAPEFKGNLDIRIVSIDLEVQSHDKETFPDPNVEMDYIGIIGVNIYEYGRKIYNRIVFSTNECDPIEGSYVVNGKTRLKKPVLKEPNYDEPDVEEQIKKNLEKFTKEMNRYILDLEKDILKKFCNVLNKLDPDIVIGYNMWGFDDKYLYKRLERYDLREYINKLSRLAQVKTELKEKELKTSAYGDNTFNYIDFYGREMMDILISIRKEHKLGSYKLDSVSEEFLNEKKHDISPTQIFEYLEQGPEKVAIIAKYCIQDTALPIKLLLHLNLIPNTIEMAKVSKVPNKWLLFRGQQCKVFSLILCYAKKRNILVPVHVTSTLKNVEGAKVLEPMVGGYMEPVAGLDFASLYPSIMRAHNLCYMTLVLDPALLNLPGVVYETISFKDEEGNPYSFTFVQDPDNCFEPGDDKSSLFSRGPKIPREKLDLDKCYKGILPEILESLAAGRKHTKNLMKTCSEEEYPILNSKQLAQKVTMNSVYGFTGAGNGTLPCLEIASCITARGRQMIEHTKRRAEEWYSCTALYGDSMPGSEYVDVNGKQVCFKDIHKITNKEWCKYPFNNPYDLLLKEPKECLDLRSEDIKTNNNKINRVIRHRTNKKLFKIKAKDSRGIIHEVVVTSDHSLITDDGKLLAGKDVKVGSMLFGF